MMNCDGIARWYRLLESLAFGGALQRRRREYINEVAGASRVLVLGDGDGRFTAEFLRRSAAAQVDSVDLSSSMLALAGRRVRACPSSRMRVRFHHGDARTIKLAGTYDLIVSHFFLDCFTPDEMPALTARIAQAACPQARWLISEFGLPNAGMGRRVAAFLIRVMYWFFRVSTGLQARRLPDYRASLAGQGFRRVRRKSVWGGFLVSELWERSL
ncbi:MAG: class I SAM-dependent methyltransferase [Acidobacteriaceae bacterium]|nr:class I SAM-dependent methyltransferase [Acidobacteriaceae bacterium]